MPRTPRSLPLSSAQSAETPSNLLHADRTSHFPLPFALYQHLAVCPRSFRFSSLCRRRCRGARSLIGYRCCCELLKNPRSCPSRASSFPCRSWRRRRIVCCHRFVRAVVSSMRFPMRG